LLPEKLKELIDMTNETMKKTLPTIFAKLCLYLPELKHQHELYKPIKANIIDTISKLNLMIEKEFKNEDHLVDINSIIRFLDSTLNENATQAHS